jgi:segregation and condensation protein A
MRSIKKKIHQVAAKAQSIASRILEIKDRLPIGMKVGMSDLIDSVGEKRRQVLITFLSLLELGKMGFVSLYQTETYQEIYIEARKPIETNVLDRVEEYDSMRADEIAASMMEKAQKIEDTEDFILPDEVDPDEQLTLQEPTDESEMASDDDILAAENEILS